jgi:hypothetical protein
MQRRAFSRGDRMTGEIFCITIGFEPTGFDREKGCSRDIRSYKI